MHTRLLTVAEQIQQKFDLSIAIALSTWQALTLAVQEQWGGPDSAEKRDWFAGAISDLFQSSPEAVDGEYLEEFMLQVMNDEFEVNVEDGSGEPVAELIIKLRKETAQGQFSRVDDMFKKWDEKQKQGGKDQVKFARVQDQDDDTDWDSDDMEQDEQDAEMHQPSIQPKEKLVPELDEDGFTKVVGRKGR